MAIQAQLADGRSLEFPDGTDPLVIQATVKRMIQQSQSSPTTSAGNLDVPGGGQVSQAKPDDRSIGENLTGIGEAALTLGTGATGGALGFAAGTVEGIARSLTGDITQNEALELAQQRAGDLTYLPRSEAGKEIVGDISETLGTLPPVGLTGGITPKIAAPFKLPKSRNKVLNALGESAPSSTKDRFTKKLGNDRFTPRIFGLVKETRRQGFDDSFTTLVANAGKTDKKKFARQIKLIEQGKGDLRKKALEGAHDIAGESLVKKFNFADKNKSQAGEQLDRVTKSLKGKEVDMANPVNNYIKSMEKLGVEFDDTGKPNFESAIFEGVTPAESLVNKIALRLKRNDNFSKADGFKAHEFKKFIDENVNYEKTEGGLSGKVDRITKTLRRDINESVGSVSDNYKQANKQFSEAATVLDELQKVAGKSVNFNGRHADKAAGVLLRSQLNNTAKRANLLTAIEDIELNVKKYGGSFDDDILSLSIFADELESIFGSRTRTAIRNEASKGGVDAAIDISQMTGTGMLVEGAKVGAKRLRGINEANQLKAIKKLVSAQ